MKSKRDNSGNVIVAVEGIIKHETEKALLIIHGDKEKWIAKSQLQKPTVQGDDETFVIFPPTWIAKVNDWNYDEYDPDDYPSHTEGEEEDTLGTCSQDYSEYPDYEDENPASF